MQEDVNRRHDFSKPTRRLVAERAGFRCSFPGCGRLTIGPNSDPNKATKNGFAAHIYTGAKSGNGPRGTGGFSEEEIKSPQNAIWLCGHHSSLIDKNNGGEYPAETLHSYKALHEARIAHELAGLSTPLGWVESVRVESSPLFSGPFKIELARLNLIIGGNSTGKTALCEWIAAHADPIYLERWQWGRPGRARLSTRLHYLNPDPHCITVDFLTAEHPKYGADGDSASVAASPLRVVFPQNLESGLTETSDELAFVSKTFNLHPFQIKALCSGLGKASKFFKRAWFEDTEEGCTMHVELHTANASGHRILKLLSSSERARLAMDLGILAANSFSAIGPTLFILDSDLCNLSPDWLGDFAEILASPDCKFQTIVSTGWTTINFENVPWIGWKTLHLEGQPPGVSIRAG